MSDEDSETPRPSMPKSESFDYGAEYRARSKRSDASGEPLVVTRGKQPGTSQGKRARADHGAEFREAMSGTRNHERPTVHHESMSILSWFWTGVGLIAVGAIIGGIAWSSYLSSGGYDPILEEVEETSSGALVGVWIGLLISAFGSFALMVAVIAKGVHLGQMAFRDSHGSR